MKYRLIGTTVPAVEIKFDAAGESMYTQSGGMSWMSDGIRMSTNTRGGLMKGIGRMFAGESLFMATYEAERPDTTIAFASTAPGQILPVDVGANGGLICQKGAFLCAQETVNLQVTFTRKFSSGLFGGEGCPTIMAHCVYSSDEEIALMKKRGVYVAHCPQSNTNLSSGIAPVRQFLEQGLSVGLGTDIAGGHSLSMLRAIADAVQVSKLRWRLLDSSKKALTFAEAFYMATMGGGSFFGKAGSFLNGFSFDALILDDRRFPHPQELTVRERLERLVYLDDGHCLTGKYVAGRKIF